MAVAAGIAQRMADGSVVFAPRQPAPAPPRTPFVQREVANEEPPPPPPPDEPPAPAPAADLDPEPGSGPVGDPGPEPSPGTPPGASGPGSTPPVTDEFVRALYPSLARLLKAELRLERERAGRLIDTRF
ncbi:hypothetical protein ABZ621_01510 [Streptomyces sp. NPDC007863]|uniref:hypothetical protein n=1 Tax=Streptomyces sp. NPDC007863 TaxID=3154894 RepID=UPI0033D2B57B